MCVSDVKQLNYFPLSTNHIDVIKRAILVTKKSILRCFFNKDSSLLKEKFCNQL